MELPPPVDVTALLPRLHDELLTLLRGLTEADWYRPTSAGAWRVRDVVAHLLDGDVRKLSLLRDGGALPPPDPPTESYRQLTRYLNRLNDEWIRAAARISPRLLVDFLAITGPQVTAYLVSRDPAAPAQHAVAWAGEEVSPNWFDAGREYTERWHHQQQIREAVGRPLLVSPEWLRPVLEISMRALPHAYRSVAAATGRTISVIATGAGGGAWSLVPDGDEGWRLYEGEAGEAACRIQLPVDSVWRLLYNGLERRQAAAAMAVTGDAGLATPLLQARAVMV